MSKILKLSSIIMLLIVFSACAVLTFLFYTQPQTNAEIQTYGAGSARVQYSNVYGEVTDVDYTTSGSNGENRYAIISGFTYELKSEYSWTASSARLRINSTNTSTSYYTFVRSGNVWTPQSGTIQIRIGSGVWEPGAEVGQPAYPEYATIYFDFILDLISVEENTTFEGKYVDIAYDGRYGEVTSISEDYEITGGIHGYLYAYIYSFTFNLNSNYQWISDNGSFRIYGGMGEDGYFEFERSGNVWTPTSGSLSFLITDGVSRSAMSITKGSVLASTSGLGVTIDFPVADLVEEVPYSTLTLDPAGGSVTPTTMQVSNGEAIGTLPTPTREGFIFDGWYVDGVEINSGDIWSYSTDKTAIAQWIEIFTLTLDANGGSVSQNAIDVINGQSIGTLPTPTRSGYRFAGWYIGDTLISSGDTWNYSADQTATAHWVQQFTLTICSNNTEFGIVTNEVSNQLFDAQSVVQSYGVGNIGFALLYWQDDLGNKIYENPLNITLTRDSVYTAVFGKAVELNGICAVDINLISETTATEVVGYAALNGYSTDNLTSVHLWATPSKGYKFEYWTVDGEILTIDGTTPYTAVCDIPLSLVQGKIVVANFSKIDNSSVNDNINN